MATLFLRLSEKYNKIAAVTEKVSASWRMLMNHKVDRRSLGTFGFSVSWSVALNAFEIQ